uniref:Uncharacterized protein n=1 Tax=Glycine max TaxID=3847 RepID=A0A0R0GTQ7_SOYBN
MTLHTFTSFNFIVGHLPPIRTLRRINDCPHKPIREFFVCFILTHIFWENFQKVTHPIITPSQARSTVEFLSNRLSKSGCILLA